MKGKIVFSLCFAVVIQFSANAQEDFSKQYVNAKELFRAGKYNLAMESFKPLIPRNQKNQFSEYASFYYALSAYNLGYKALAKSSLNEIKTLYNSWEKLDEVNFWIGKINLEDKDYFQGMKVFSGINDVSLLPVIESLKTKSIGEITDPETIKMLHEEYPKDRIVAKALAVGLSKNLTNPTDRILLDSLITEFTFNRSDYIPEAPKTYYRDIYSVSVLLPFMANTLDPSPTPKRNQAVLDLYEGMKLAVDTLSRQGVKINLRAYDTERSVEKIKSVLKTDELKNTDLIIGPYFQEESKPILEFSLANKINVFNPLHNNSELVGINPFSFLYQPSLEGMGKKSGEFLSRYVYKKNCMVFYGTSKRDSILAASFMEAARANGLKITASHRLTKEASKMILSTLATPTEYDEFRYPKQFTLKKDSLGSIFVASDDALIYAKVISSIETRGDNIVVLGSESWLDRHTVDLEKFQNLPVVLTAPNFTASEKPATIAFVKKYIKKHGRTPSGFASLGYDLMLFLGNQLKKNGVYFQEALSRAGVMPGYLSEGYNYQQGRSNDLIPFIRFDQGQIKVVEKR
jgi:ABC-type branched-subunit amino acid transport system substrate-binding protein